MYVWLLVISLCGNVLLLYLFIHTRRSARLDHLTKVYHFRSFKQRLERQIRRAERKNIPVALFFLDVDYFKSINDQYGHTVGDEILIKFIDRLKRQTKSDDLIARYGGEEFILCFYDCNLTQACSIAKRIHQQVLGQPFKVKEHLIPITVSMGITIHPTVPQHQLLELADQMMYLAKGYGRNCSVYYDPKRQDGVLIRM